ncbi:MAG: protein kinase domain-containing protein [Isosphaeraceae bacterium]
MSAGEGSKETIDSISSRDVEECLRVLDEVWPADDDEAPGAPRQLGRFSIVSELGRGGFGVVFLAEDPLLERRVALKVPRVEVFAQSQGWRRFLREARTASRLDHPNLVPLLETGTIGPVGYIVSAFVEGPTLEQCLQDARGGAPARFSARLVAALAGAIEHMHDRGILHRDLKPANILMQAPESGGDLLTRYPWDGDRAIGWVPRICDFGLAVLREIDGDETRTRLGAGSPSYMAPEQAEARHDDIGPATDIYGLGATLYQLLTGRPPFTGASELETLRRVVADEPARPRHLRADVPRDLETICLKCLAKRPEQRYASAAALAEDLERFLEGRPILARPVPAWERAWKWTRRHPALAALATATALAVFAGLGGLIWHESALRQVNEQLSAANQQLRGVNEQLRVAVEEKEENARLLRRQLAVRRISEAKQAVTAGNFELAQRLLDEAEPEPELGTPGQPGFACSYLRRFARERLDVLRGHRGAVLCFAESPDGGTLASGDETGEIRLWDLETARCRLVLAAGARDARQLIFAPDGKSLASFAGDPEQIQIWEIPTGRLRGRLDGTGPSDRIWTIFFRPGDRRLSVLWSLQGSLSPAIASWEIRPDGVFPVAQGRASASMPSKHRDRRLQYLVDLLDGISAPGTGTHSYLATDAAEYAPGVVITRDGALAVHDAGDGTIDVRRAADHIRLALGRVRPEGAAIVLYGPTSFGAKPPPGERERLERLARGLVPQPSAPEKGPNLVIRATVGETAAVTPDGRRLAIFRGVEKRIDLIDLNSGQTEASLNLSAASNVYGLSFTEAGATLAIGSRNRPVRLWHLRSPRQPVVIAGHTPKEAWALSYSPDGRTLASGGDDHQIRLWDPATGRAKGTLSAHKSLVTSLAFSPDGRTLASGSFDRSRPVILWDVATRRPRLDVKGHTDRVRGIAFSPDGLVLASSSDDHTDRLWNVRDGSPILAIPEPAGLWANGVAFSPDGHIVAAARSNRIVLADSTSGKIRTITAADDCFPFVFSPDGGRLYCGHGGGSITAWDVARCQQVASIPAHDTSVYSLAVSADGATLVSAGEDRTVRLWDTITRQELLCLTDCKARVNAVAFSPDGNSLAAADHSGAITIWHAGRAPK